MRRWLKGLDELLRGGRTRAEQLAAGTEQLTLGPYVGMSAVLGAVYGACMGLYSVLSRTPPLYAQLIASTFKVPLLFLFTLVVTFPSLYVFGALLGARLRPVDALRVIVASIAVNLAVLASFGPITAFFTLTTTNYHFMKLLNVVFLALAGLIGLGFLLNVLHRLEAAQSPRVLAGMDSGTGSPSAGDSALQTPPARADAGAAAPVARRVFKAWLILYALVGAQMGWILRPFIGSPDLPFTWFRQRGGNVFLDVIRTIGELLRS